jgi:rod shape-determining protein MreD
MKKYITLIILMILELFLLKYHLKYFYPLLVYFYTILKAFTIKETKAKYKFLMVAGILTDMINATYFINTFLYITIYYLFEKITKRISLNNITIFIYFMLLLLFYRTFTYFILVLIKYKTFQINILIDSILTSILFNYIFLLFTCKIIKISN